MCAAGGAGLAARAGGGGRACAHSGVSSGRLQQQPSSSRSSSKGGGGLKTAALAACEAATRYAQLGSQSHRDAAWGGVVRVFGGRFGAHRLIMREKSWDRLMLFCRVVLVSVRPACAFLTLPTLLYTQVCRTWV